MFNSYIDLNADEYFDALDMNNVSLDDLIESENYINFGCDLDCSNCPDVFWCEQNN